MYISREQDVVSANTNHNGFDVSTAVRSSAVESARVPGGMNWKLWVSENGTEFVTVDPANPDVVSNQENDCAWAKTSIRRCQ